MTVPNLANGAVITEPWVDAVTTDVNLLTDSKSAASVATSQTTTSTTFVDLATVGPSVTMTTGTLVRISIRGALSVTIGNTARMSVAVSGATTITAANMEDSAVNNLRALSTNTTTDVQDDSQIVAVTAGSNTFTMKYRATGGTATFAGRYLVVERLN